ncbi:MAG: NUDIX hydrolase [Niabella sp.]|nr:MAG: NUDIX hydrolase [Niabella sp.]
MLQNSSHVLIFNDQNEIFIIKRTDFPVWSITGGGIEQNEDPKSAALRECKEEAGFDIDISNLKIHYKYYAAGSESSLKHGYVFVGKYLSGDYIPEFSGNIGKWFALNKLPLSMTYQAKQMIFDLIRHKDTTKTIEIEINKTPKSRLALLSTIQYKWRNLYLLLLHPIFVVKNFKSLRRMQLI